VNARLLGALLLVLGFILLVTGPEGFSPLHMGGFLGSFVYGMLLLSGILGRSPRVRALQSGRVAPISRRPPLPVTAREFRYPRPGLGVKTTFTLLSLVWVALSCFGFLVPSFTLGQRLAMGFGLLVPAALTWLYYFAHYRQVVLVGPEGIRMRGYLRTVTLRWDEIVALEDLTVHSLGVGTVGSIYRVYGRSRYLRFFQSVEHAGELTAIVRAASGLDWNGA